MTSSPGRLIMSLVRFTVALTLVSTSAVLGMHEHVSFEELAFSADGIFVGTVTSQSSRVGPKGNTILTDVTFTATEAVHQREGVTLDTGTPVTLTYEGGQIGELGLWVSDTPSLNVGETYLLFTLMDGKTYTNPLIGGNQGLFRVIGDEVTGAKYVLTAGRSGIIGVEHGQLKTAPKVEAIRDGQVEYAPASPIDTNVPQPVGDTELAGITRVVERPKSILTLKQFVSTINATLSGPAPTKRILKHLKDTPFPEGATRLPGKTLTDTALQQYLAGEPLPTPPQRDGNENAAEAENTEGDDLFYCGSQDVHIVMEQVPESWWSYDDNTTSMLTYNNYMDIYHVRDSDGGVGDNYESEFAGWFTSSQLDDVYGVGWGSAIAKCRTWYIGGQCDWVYESDVMFKEHADLAWSNNINYTLGQDPVLYLPVLMHEMGHTWGMQRGTENYNYDEPSVMHSYYHHLVENGRGIHFPEAWAIRRNYDDQTSIRDYNDIGLESYCAQDGLHNSVTDRWTQGGDNGAYQTGEPITLQNITIENSGYEDCGQIQIRFYLSDDRGVDTFSDYPLGAWQLYSMTRESHWVGNLPGTIPNDVPTGTYYIVGNIWADDSSWENIIGINNQTSFFNTVRIESPAPGSPTGVSATDGTSSSHTIITWNTVPGATNYEVWRDVTPVFNTAQKLITAGPVNQYYDSSGTPGAVYYYRLRALSGGGSPGPYSSHDTGWRKLAYPGSVFASNGTSADHVHVTWDPVDGATHYKVYANTADDKNTAWELTFNWLDETEYFDTAANPVQTYYYWVVAAADSLGSQATDRNDFASDSGHKAPAAPTNVDATNGTYTDHVHITWDAVEGTVSYRVYRGTDTYPQNATALGTWQSGTSYDDYSASTGTAYYYWVRATGLSTMSDWSIPDLGRLAWPPIDAPTGVAATDGDYTTYIRVTWNAVSGGTYYRVYRNPDPDPETAISVTGWISATSYNDFSPPIPGKMYYYWVKAAMSSSGYRESDFSNGNGGHLRLEPPIIDASDGLYSDRVRIEWDPVDGANYYQLYRGISNNASHAAAITGWITSSAYNDYPPNECGTYYYWAKAAVYRTGSRSSELSWVNAGHRSVRTPQNLAATDGDFIDKIHVSWSPVPGASHYELRRNTDSDPSTAMLLRGGWQPDTEYDDTTADAGETYYYFVRASASSTGDCASAYADSERGWAAFPAPTNLTATDGEFDDHVYVDWDQSESLAASRVWRGRSPNQNMALPLTGWIWPRYYHDYDVEPGQTYFYWVQGGSGEGLHPTSAAGYDAGWRKTIPPTGVTATKGTFMDYVLVNWNPTDEATHYRVYRYNYNIANGSTPVSGWITDTSFEDTTAQPTVHYFYWIKAAVSDTGTGESGYSPEALGWLGTEPPAIVSAISRRAHTGAGHFDLDVTSETSVEPRTAGPTWLQITFDKQVQAADGLDLHDVVASSGAISRVDILDGFITVEVEIYGVRDQEQFSIGFPGISDTFNRFAVVTDHLCFGVCEGDAQQSGSVNVFDLFAVRNALTKPLDATTCRCDINCDGSINVFDLFAVRNKLTHTVQGDCPDSHDN